MHTRHIGIESTWKQPITNSPKYFRVFVWKSAEEMRAAFKAARYWTIDLSDCIGLCHAHRQGYKNNRRVCGKRFAEVHLIREYIGAGMVSHELYHLVNYWSNFKDWKPQDNSIHDERVALLTGRIVSRFWKEFYKRYDRHDEHLT